MKKRNLKNRILALTTCTLVLIGALMLPIGAEAIPQTFNSNTIYDYPGANLLPYPYSTFSNGSTDTINGITYEMQEYGLIVTGGTATAYSYKHLYMDSFPAGTYTISGGNSEIRLIADVYVNGTYLNSAENSSFVVPENASISVYVAINTNKTIDAVIYPMINVGDVAYPYQPYLPYYFQQAYNEGYDNGYNNGHLMGHVEGYVKGEAFGYETGYKEGFREGEKDRKSIFEYATYNGKLYYNLNDGNGQQTKDFSFTPSLINSGVYFEPLLDEIYNWSKNTYGDNLYILSYTDYVLVEIKWNDKDAVDYNQFPIYITGDTDVSGGKIKTINNKTYTVYAEQYGRTDEEGKPNKSKFEPTLEIDNLIINYFAVHVGRPDDLLTSFTLFSESEFYNNGYKDGYNIGYETGDNEGFIRGQSTGYNNGFTKGKEEALKITESGSWTNLFTAVAEAPINTFQSLFSFEILGLDMRVAFGAMMSICVLLIIIKKVIL